MASDLIPPRTEAENEELLRRWEQHDAFSRWVDANYPALHDPWELEYHAHMEMFNTALGHWQAETLGEMRTQTLPGMEA